MHVAVISDLHLGAGGKADSFGHDDGHFLRFLSHLEQNFERIVLLGDIWETLTGRLPGMARHALQAARAAHPEIARRFQSSQYLYVHGNHDLVAGAAEQVPDEWMLEVDGLRIWFAHGHQGDPLIQSARWVSELGVWLGGMLRRMRLDDVQRVFEKLDKLRERFQVKGEETWFQDWAVAAARRRGADVVVTGHTHDARRQEHGSQLFLNSGSCSGGKFSFLALDTRSPRFSVEKTW